MNDDESTGKYVFKLVGPPWKREIKTFPKKKSDQEDKENGEPSKK